MDKFTRDQVFQRAVSKMDLPLPLMSPGFVYTGLKDDWRTPMTEAEWLASDDPAKMLAFVESCRGGSQLVGSERAGYRPWSGPLGPRRLRLYAAGLVRLVWDGRECVTCGGIGGRVGSPPPGVDWSNERCPDCSGTGRVGGLQDPRSRRAVEVAELYADGLATSAEFNAACIEAGNARKESPFCPWNEQTPDANIDMVMLAVTNLFQPSAHHAARECLRLTSHVVPPATQASLLRCAAGNPFRPVSIPLDRQVGRTRTTDFFPTGIPLGECSWLTPTVIALAERAYEERCPADCLAVLADKIEDEGGGEVKCQGCDGTGGLFGPPTKMPDGTVMLYGGRCPRCPKKDDWHGAGRVPNPLLQHLRSAGPHCRGCWVIDLLLGKE